MVNFLSLAFLANGKTTELFELVAVNQHPICTNTLRFFFRPLQSFNSLAGFRSIMVQHNFQNALMTGDTNLLDVAQAKQAGMRTAQANWFRQNEQTYAIPDLTLESPEQLRELVELNK